MTILAMYPFSDRAEVWPEWSEDYTYTVKPSVTVSGNGYGKKRQVKNTDRNTMRVPVKRVFTGNEADIKLEYFEAFVRIQLNNGANKFLDYVADFNGLNLHTVRILNGSYNVSSNGVSHTVSCELEIFRNVA